MPTDRAIKMPPEPIQILNYANAAHRPGRYRHLFGFFPFVAGLALGGGLSAVMIVTAPDFLSILLWPLLLIVAIILTAGAALILLLLIGAFSSSPRMARAWQTCVIIGAAVPVLGTFAALAGSIVHVLVSPPAWMFSIAGWLMLGYLAVLGCCPAFALVRWGQTLPPQEQQRKQLRSILKTTGIAVVVLALIVAGGGWCAQRIFDRRCRALASWVANNHPAAGELKDLNLPESFSGLADDEKVNAVVTADHRVILLLKTELSFHYNWSGVIYSTGPIAPGEIGPDGWGRTMINIKGLPYHFIERQRDSQHFEVGSDVD